MYPPYNGRGINIQMVYETINFTIHDLSGEYKDLV